jgi:hypothetical protein
MKCPACGGDLITFTADLDICKSCGTQQPGQSREPTLTLAAALESLHRVLGKYKASDNPAVVVSACCLEVEAVAALTEAAGK